MPFDRTKMLTGCSARASSGRAEADLERLVDEVEEEITKSYDREVPTEWSGDGGRALRRLDQVAYVRFASVYRRFKTVDELMEEARAVIDAARFEDPQQGKLFLEAQQAAGKPAEGGKQRQPRRCRGV